jgi:crotonobetainyl-CoA:carnitine CoA-transferase CaiB-like acyl-CoA transferase
MQAFGGIMSVTGEDGRPYGPAADRRQGAGLWSTVGILAALQNRTRTGQGCVVDTSLYEAALSWMTVPSALALASGKDLHRTGSGPPCWYHIGRSDGGQIHRHRRWKHNLFRRFAAACSVRMGRNPQFQTNAGVRNRDLLNGLVAEVIARESCDIWMERLDRAGCRAPHSVHDGGDEASAN